MASPVFVSEESLPRRNSKDSQLSLLEIPESITRFATRHVSPCSPVPFSLAVPLPKRSSRLLCDDCGAPIERQTSVDPIKCPYKLHHACYCEGALTYCKGCSLSFRRCEFNGHPHPSRFVHEGGATHITTLEDLVALVRENDTESLATQLSHVVPEKLFLARSETFDNSPLHAACAACAPAAVLLLLHAGAPVDARARSGWTPLHVAALRGTVECAQHLLEHRADVDATDDDLCTPAHKAASLGHADVLALLIRHGAGLGECDRSGMMPLHIAALRGYLDCVQCLLRWMPATSLCARDSAGRTAAHHAAAEGHTEILRCLLAASPSLLDATANGENLQQLANRFRRKACVDLLRSIHRAAAPEEHVWPIHDAAMAGNISRVEFYLDKGAPINGPDEEGNTLLHCACFSGHADLVALLLRRGADASLCNHHGVTPLVLAQQNNHHQCCAPLVSSSTPSTLPSTREGSGGDGATEPVAITPEAMREHLAKRLVQLNEYMQQQGLVWPEVAARDTLEAGRARLLADLRAELARERIVRERLEMRRDTAEHQRLARAVRERANRPTVYPLRRAVRPGEPPRPITPPTVFASPLLLPRRLKE